MLAHLAWARTERAALSCSSWAADPAREPDGKYWTGIVYPEEVHFPAEEQSTYTAAAVVLAADALRPARAPPRRCSSTTTRSCRR